MGWFHQRKKAKQNQRKNSVKKVKNTPVAGVFLYAKGIG